MQLEQKVPPAGALWWEIPVIQHLPAGAGTSQADAARIVSDSWRPVRVTWSR